MNPVMLRLVCNGYLCPLFTLLIYTNCLNLFGQADFSFRQLSVNEGLSQNSAVSISQDREGYLWIATQEGLNKYDGIDFSVYNKKFPDVTEEKRLLLGKVMADSQNRVWIIPDTAIPELLDRVKNQFFAIEGIKAANCLFEDERNNILFGTLSGQLYRWNGVIQKAEMIWTAPELEFVSISQYDAKNLLLVFKHSLAILNIETQHYEVLWDPGEDVYLSSVKLDQNSNIWVGTLNRGLWRSAPNRVDNHHFLPYWEGSEAESNMVLEVFVDSNDRIWAATYGKGALLIEANDSGVKFFEYSKQNPRSIHYNDILCIFEDYTGTLWFGSDGAGLSFYDRYLEKFNFFHNQQVPENIHIDVVRAIYVDEFQHVWLGTSGKGLTRFDPKTGNWRTYTHQERNPESIKSNRIMSLLGDEKGKLWIGYQDEGLSILDIASEKLEHFDASSALQMPGRTIWKIFKDSEDRFWLGTRNNGLLLFDPEKGLIRQYTHIESDPNSIPDNNIRTVIEDADGKYWIGTENQGIAKFDLKTGNFQNFRNDPYQSQSISSNNIKSLYLSQQNELWIGTNGAGLNKMDLRNQEITIFNTDSGLSNDVIYGVLPDKNGDLWLSSNKGITKIGIVGGSEAKYRITNYSNYDGLATEFNTGAYFKAKDGTLYFGSLEGFYWFNASDIALNEVQPKTAITEISIFNKPIGLSENLNLKHFENTITINMASLVFSSPAKNQFLYKLENHDEDWVFNGNNHQARYTNLSPGNYTFMAKSSNYDGIWNEEPITLEIKISPPWYLTIWAKIVYIMMSILTILGIYQYLKWRLKMQLSLKQKEDEALRLIEIDAFKSNLFTNISHEFRTPLTLILGPVERLINTSESPIFKSQLNLIKQQSTRLLNLVDQLLEVSRIKSGKHQLKVRKGNLSLLMQSIVSNFFYQAAEKNMKIKPKIPLMSEVWFDGDKIEKIITNLLQNAIKYGKPQTDIFLKSKLVQNLLELELTNISIKTYSQQEIKHLFDKFYKADVNAVGFGIGLALVKDLVELNQGKISLDFDEKTGAFMVRVHLPVDKYTFRPEEVEEDDNREAPMVPTEKTEGPKEQFPLILVIEDKEEVRKFICEELRLYYDVVEAKDGKEGIFTAFKKIPDLVISDVMMPEKDGIEVCNILKNDEKTSHIPIILLTAKSEETDKIKGLEVGADDYILKPFSIQQLLIRIQKLIELRKNLRIRYSEKISITPNEIAVSSTDEKFLQKIQGIVDKDLADGDFSVQDFCKKLGMSRMQLHRKLTALTGLSTTAFIRDQRLRLALQRLNKSGESISEIAYAVGFSSPSYFIKCFKETYQMTPNEYLTNHKGKEFQ